VLRNFKGVTAHDYGRIFMPKLFMGLDIGSTTSKCVILDSDRRICAKSLVIGGAGTSGSDEAVRAALAEVGAMQEDISRIVVTGYGRGLVEGAHKQVSELSCHAVGAHELHPGARTVIDIGGQDAKVLKLGITGMLERFVMNDKCAAGTGRFLEEMSRVLEVPINLMAEEAARSTERIDISSTCVVFAETEVVSQLSHGAATRDILNGVFRSIASRVTSLAQREGITPEVVMTGGVARNEGVRLALEEEFGETVSVSPLAQYAGALGAALFALKD
jgi:predicted CoA-substrate-specific enzyme activase